MEGEMDIKVNFSGRAIRYTEEEIAVVVEAMRNADPLTQGQYMRAFESKFARYQGVADGSCFTTMNGCAALEMSALPFQARRRAGHSLAHLHGFSLSLS